MLLSDAIQGFWLDRRMEVSASTVKTYNHWFTLLTEFLEDKQFSQITPSDLRRFFSYLLEERELSRRSVHDSWIPLSSLWTWAENELKTAHVIREGKIKPLKFTEKPVEPFTQKDRFVFLGSRAQKSIWRMLINRKGAKPTDPLFAAKTVKRLDRNNLRHMIQGIAKRVGVSNAHPHRFRHTFAITFLRNGGNVAELQRILGHREIEMSLRYARLAEIDLEGVMHLKRKGERPWRP